MKDFEETTPVLMILNGSLYMSGEEIQKKECECLKLMQESGADMLSSNKVGKTILHDAFYHSRYETLKFVLETIPVQVKLEYSEELDSDGYRTKRSELCRHHVKK